MVKGVSTTIWRPLAVWSAVTATATAATRAVPGAWSAADDSPTYGGVTDLLVAACSTALALALIWLWVITTVVVVELFRDGGRAGVARTGGGTRRLVLVACGVAVVAGTSVPALASGGDGRELLAGLALPERAVAPPAAQRTPRPLRQVADHSAVHPRATYVVRPRDSLWSIALAHPDAEVPIEHRWRAIWRANLEVVGDDPDLILPGQALLLPSTDDPGARPRTTQDPHSDGDR